MGLFGWLWLDLPYKQQGMARQGPTGRGGGAGRVGCTAPTLGLHERTITPSGGHLDLWGFQLPFSPTLCSRTSAVGPVGWARERRGARLGMACLSCNVIVGLPGHQRVQGRRQGGRGRRELRRQTVKRRCTMPPWLRGRAACQSRRCWQGWPGPHMVPGSLGARRVVLQGEGGRVCDVTRGLLQGQGGTGWQGQHTRCVLCIHQLAPDRSSAPLSVTAARRGSVSAALLGRAGGIATRAERAHSSGPSSLHTISRWCTSAAG